MHTAQGGIYRGLAVAFTFFTLALFGWGSAGASAVVGFLGRVEDEIRSQSVAWGLRLSRALAVGWVDQGTTWESLM